MNPDTIIAFIAVGFLLVLIVVLAAAGLILEVKQQKVKVKIDNIKKMEFEPVEDENGFIKDNKK